MDLNPAVPGGQQNSSSSAPATCLRSLSDRLNIIVNHQLFYTSSVDQAIKMRVVAALILIGSAAAVAESFVGKIAVRSSSMNEWDKIFGREVTCKPVATPSCEDSCGPGYVVCASWPNCYNPGMGQICCSDGGQSFALKPPLFHSLTDLL